MDGPGVSPTSIGATLMTGIQDISALLPLLGTEQCEEHVGSALSDGYLYAVASPMSIFGSLGIARTGFKALLASVSIPRWRFIGAEKLRDAGFRPSGKNLSLIMMDPDHVERHLAETRLDLLLKTSQIEELHVEDLSRLTITTTCHHWNVKMLLLTAVSCIVGITPYILLNADRGGNRLDPFTRWAFPITRLLGGFLTTTSIQLLIQRRLITILKNRLIFHALNNGENTDILSSQHPMQTLFHWDFQNSSELCLWRLGQVVRRRVARRETFVQIIITYIRRSVVNIRQFFNRSSPGDGELELRGRPSNKPDTFDGPIEGTRPSHDLESGVGHVSDQRALVKLGEELDEANRLMFPAFDLWGSNFRILIALGIVASVVGYVGCFSVVQGARRPIAPIIWLLLEGILSIFRMVIWGWNPESDDSDPIKVSLELDSHPPLSTCNKPLNQIFDSKILPLVRSPEFLRSIKSYTGFLKPFDIKDVSLFYTLTRKSVEVPGIYERVLFITMVDHKERTPMIYYEDDRGVSQFFAASPLTVDLTHDVLQTEIKEAIDLARLPIMESPGQRFALEAHYRSIVGQLRLRDGDPDASVDEIRMNWTLSQADTLRTTSQKGLNAGLREDHRENEVVDDDFMYFQQPGYQLKRQRRSALQQRWLECYMAAVEIQTRSQLKSLPSHAPSETVMMCHDALILERFGLESLFLYEIRTWESHLWSGQKEFLDKIAKRKGKSHSTDLAAWRLKKEWARSARARLSDDQATTSARLAKARDEWATVLSDLPDEDALELKRMWEALQTSVDAEWWDLIQDCENEEPFGNPEPNQSPNELITTSGRLRLSLEQFTISGERRFRSCVLLYNYWKEERERRFKDEAKDVQGWINRGLANYDGTLSCVDVERSIVPQMFVGPAKWIAITQRMVETESMEALSRAIQRNSYISIIQFSDFQNDEDLAKAISAIISRTGTPSSLTTIAIPDRSIQIGDHTVSALTAIVKENSVVQSIFVNHPLADSLGANALPAPQLPYGQEVFSSFIFHGFGVEVSSKIPMSEQFISTRESHISELGSKVEVRFFGRKDDKVRLRLHHDCFEYGYSGKTLSLHANHEIQETFLLASTEVTKKSIWFSPVINVESDILNVITITPPRNIYILYAIDLVDENGIPYGYKAPLQFLPNELVSQPQEPPEPPAPEIPPPDKPGWRNVTWRSPRSRRKRREAAPQPPPPPPPPPSGYSFAATAGWGDPQPAWKDWNPDDDDRLRDLWAPGRLVVPNPGDSSPGLFGPRSPASSIHRESDTRSPGDAGSPPGGSQSHARAQDPWSELSSQELTRKMSWDTWKPDYSPSGRSTPVSGMTDSKSQGRESPGLFGPRSPASSIHRA